MQGDYHSFERIFSSCQFSHVEPFDYNNAPNEGTVTFLAKFGAISPCPPKLGEEAMNPNMDTKITPNPRLFQK